MAVIQLQKLGQLYMEKYIITERLTLPLACGTGLINGLRQANLVLIAYASSEGSGEPAHPRSLTRTSAARW